MRAGVRLSLLSLVSLLTACNLLIGDYSAGADAAVVGGDAVRSDVWAGDGRARDRAVVDTALPDAWVADAALADRGGGDLGARDVVNDDVGVADVVNDDVGVVDVVTGDVGGRDAVRPMDATGPADGMPSDATPQPPNPTDFVAVAGYGAVTLTLTMPGAESCEIWASEGDYPSALGDGRQVTVVQGEGVFVVVDSVVVPDTTYFYAVFCQLGGVWNTWVVVGDNAASATPDHGWWDSAWARRIRLNLLNAGRGEDLVDFPLFVSLDPAAVNLSAHVHPEGLDLRFIDPDGPANPLAAEFEAIDSGNFAHLWIKVPQIDAGTDSDFVYLYYDNPGATTAYVDPPGVWSNGYLSVHHFGQEALLADSTLYGHDADYVGGVEAQLRSVGAIDSGIYVDGLDDRVSLASQGAFDFSNQMTVSAWIQMGSVQPSGSTMVGKGTAWRLARDVSGVPQFAIDGADNGAVVLTSTLLGGGEQEWHHLTGVVDGALITLYVDGLYDNSATFLDQLALTSADVAFGATAVDTVNYLLWYAGGLDEVRIAQGPRSADWVDAQHASMTDALVAWGSAEELRP